MIKDVYDGGVTKVFINNVPFLKKLETINGGRIERISAWNHVLKPTGKKYVVVEDVQGNNS